MGAETQDTVALKPGAPHRRYLPTRPAPARPDRPRRLSNGLYAGEPETCRRGWRPFLRAFLHLALLAAVFRVYRIEERAFQGRAFQTLVAVALCALPIHYLAPYRYKRGLFIAASLVGLGMVIGPNQAAAVVAFATILIGCCRLPIPWIARASLVATLGATFAWLRSRGLVLPDPVWSILASMFMFRILIYLYELKHSTTREPLASAFSYFLILPNYAFLHFPVVDYRTMERGYFSQPIGETMERGLQMTTRGAIHLLCYRLIYHELLISPSEVHSPGGLILYLVCNYLLYLQVSGQFHIACGMLHLFGFRLPDTHHNYLLADGFTDYWRRINIYWRDFMVRLVWNPVVFSLKRRPRPITLIAGTCAVFVATWLLHAYQSFWLRGTWGFTAPDALFWGILGALVLASLLREGRRKSSRPAPSSRILAGSLKCARVGLTFCSIALIWSLWSSPSVGAWFDLLSRGIMGR